MKTFIFHSFTLSIYQSATKKIVQCSIAIALVFLASLGSLFPITSYARDCKSNVTSNLEPLGIFTNDLLKLRVDNSNFQFKTRQLLNVQDRCYMYIMNNDINDVPGYAGVYSAQLPHTTGLVPDYLNGYVIPDNFKKMLLSLTGDVDLVNDVGYVNIRSWPTIPYFITLYGPNLSSFPIPIPPAFNSNQTAGEMIEIYNAGLARDVPFSDYPNSPIVANAVNDLNNFIAAAPGHWVGPNPVTKQNLFTFFNQSNLSGPALSQLFFARIPGAAQAPFNIVFNSTTSLIRTPSPDIGAGPSRITSDRLWRRHNPWSTSPAVRNLDGSRDTSFTTTTPLSLPHYANSGRDLAFFIGDGSSSFWLSMSQVVQSVWLAPLNPGNPFVNGTLTFPAGNVNLFATFDFNRWLSDQNQAALVAHILKNMYLVPRPGPIAVEVDRYREFKGQPGFVSNYTNSILLDSSNPANPNGITTLSRVFQQNGSHFLSQTVAIGNNTSAAYPSAHATQLGAYVTIMKAIYDWNYMIPATLCFQPSAPDTLTSIGMSLQLGDELDKFAYNTLQARLFYGIVKRSDLEQGLLLGEEFAIRYLREQAHTYSRALPSTKNPSTGWHIRKFDGTVIDILVP